MNIKNGDYLLVGTKEGFFEGEVTYIDIKVIKLLNSIFGEGEINREDIFELRKKEVNK